MTFFPEDQKINRRYSIHDADWLENIWNYSEVFLPLNTDGMTLLEQRQIWLLNKRTSLVHLNCSECTTS